MKPPKHPEDAQLPGEDAQEWSLRRNRQKTARHRDKLREGKPPSKDGRAGRRNHKTKFPEDARVLGEDEKLYQARRAQNAARRHTAKQTTADKQAIANLRSEAAREKVRLFGRVFRGRGKNNIDPQLPGENKIAYRSRTRHQAIKRHRVRHPDQIAARRLELYRMNGPGRGKIAWIAANQDKIKEYSRRDFERNRSEKLAKLKAWTASLAPQDRKDRSRRWAKAHPEVFTASAARNRAKIIQRTPVWLSTAQWKEIERFYGKAKTLTRQTSVEHQVDHIVPLNGKRVSGLHVPWNLQVLSKADNLAKRNHFDSNDPQLGIEALLARLGPAMLPDQREAGLL